MRRTLCATSMISLGFVLSAWMLRTAPPVTAGAGSPTHVSFSISLDRDQTRVLGTVPSNRTLVLHDFHVDLSVGLVEVLADGVPVSPQMEIGAALVMRIASSHSSREFTCLAVRS